MITQIINAKVLLPSGVEKTNIEIENGIITSISQKLRQNKSAKIYDAENKYVIPGFIDLHTNGIAGFDLTNGLFDVKKKRFSISKENYYTGIDRALQEYAKHGTTLVGFTTLEASITKLKKIFKYIADYKSNENNKLNDIFHGIYMEGTFMKDERFKGAHNHKYFFEPSINLFTTLQKAASGNIKIVNVVPEWGKSALKLIEYFSKMKIISAAGHTSATGDDYIAAIKKGLHLAIHVLNGPSSSSFKPFNNGGALETFLTSDKMYLEIIMDGYHVNKSYVLDIIKRKGVDKCIAITDSMFATNSEHIKQFKINGVVGKVSKNGEYIQIAGKEDLNALFGSILTMDKAFANILTWFTQPIEGIWNQIHKPLSLNEALVVASKMCSLNPAKILGVYSDGNKNTDSGSIENNKRANLIITDIVNKNQKYQLKIDKVFLKGNVVYSK